MWYNTTTDGVWVHLYSVNGLIALTKRFVSVFERLGRAVAKGKKEKGRISVTISFKGANPLGITWK